MDLTWSQGDLFVSLPTQIGILSLLLNCLINSVVSVYI